MWLFFVIRIIINGKIVIFDVIFGQNLLFLPPGVTLYSVTTCCLAINFEKLLSGLALNVFMG